jgi:hypothetical protein
MPNGMSIPTDILSFDKAEYLIPGNLSEIGTVWPSRYKRRQTLYLSHLGNEVDQNVSYFQDGSCFCLRFCYDKYLVG